MSICLSVRTEQLNYDWSDFHEILYLRTFQKAVEKIQVSLKSDKNNGKFKGRPVHCHCVCGEGFPILVFSWTSALPDDDGCGQPKYRVSNENQNHKIGTVLFIGE